MTTRSSTPRCATAPSARGSATRSSTSSPSPGCWTSSASGFIEGGWPGAMPKDTEFFRRARTELDLKHAVLVAFGATRKAGVDGRTTTRRCGRCSTRETPVVCLVAKSDIRHVERALRTTARGEPRDGPRHGRLLRRARAGGSSSTASTSSTATAYDPDYTAPVVPRPRSTPAPRRPSCATPTAACCRRMVTARRGRRAGRACSASSAVTGSASTARTTPSCAVANTVAAVEAGVTHFQCTANGYGERPGNADLFAVVGNLQLKLGHAGPTGRVPRADGAGLARHRRDRQHRPRHPPGRTSGPPRSLTRRGCTRARSRWIRCSTTTSTRRSSATTCGSWSPRWPAGPASSSRAASSASTWPAIRTPCPRVTQRVKELEARRLVVRGRRRVVRAAGPRRSCRARPRRAVRAGVVPGASVEHREDGAVVSEATVKVRVRGERVIATAEGNGPVNALDEALRVALTRHYPELAGFELADYKVRILEGSARHRRGHPGAGRDHGDGGRGLDHRRRARERGRGELARPGRRAHLRPGPRRGRHPGAARGPCRVAERRQAQRAGPGRRDRAVVAARQPRAPARPGRRSVGPPARGRW